ncbi:MAG TPA: DUF4433 domain-containing protein [Candidatus Bathyarchaeia archaeon]|nr:DUF4433 domain-containing protein [Candidatus Bathyarchaeia archaeon]
MKPPTPTPIFRLVPVDNLTVLLQRGGLHAPNHIPSDGLLYKVAHNVELQAARSRTVIPCGPRGTVHDYVPFYFGALSPMLLKLKTGQVEGYNDGQAPLIYLVSTAQTVAGSGSGFVFSDGHGYVAYTEWFDDLSMLSKVDWKAVAAQYWGTQNDPTGELKRRKQAEFLIHRFCDWSLIQDIAVINEDMKARVEAILNGFPKNLRRVVKVKREWYY